MTALLTADWCPYGKNGYFRLVSSLAQFFYSSVLPHVFFRELLLVIYLF